MRRNETGTYGRTLEDGNRFPFGCGLRRGICWLVGWSVGLRFCFSGYFSHSFLILKFRFWVFAIDYLFVLISFSSILLLFLRYIYLSIYLLRLCVCVCVEGGRKGAGKVVDDRWCLWEGGRNSIIIISIISAILCIKVVGGRRHILRFCFLLFKDRKEVGWLVGWGELHLLRNFHPKYIYLGILHYHHQSSRRFGRGLEWKRNIIILASLLDT